MRNVPLIPGLIDYDPPCSDSGQTMRPGFYSHGMNTSITAQFRVVD